MSSDCLSTSFVAKLTEVIKAFHVNDEQKWQIQCDPTFHPNNFIFFKHFFILLVFLLFFFTTKKKMMNWNFLLLLLLSKQQTFSVLKSVGHWPFCLCIFWCYYKDMVIKYELKCVGLSLKQEKKIGRIKRFFPVLKHPTEIFSLSSKRNMPTIKNRKSQN